MKIPLALPPVPRLSIVSARWQATCGRCLARSRIVSATTDRDAWNEIAFVEGWVVYQPEPGFETYPVCLTCADAMLADDAKRLVR